MMKFKSVFLSNYYAFKKVPWQIVVPKAQIDNRPVFGNYIFPVSSVSLWIESGPATDRMTATRILTGGILAGPIGLLLGSMMRKDTTYFALVFETTQGTFRVPFSKKEWKSAHRFVEMVAQYAAETATAAA
jgi:hypothetical protein